MLFFSRSISVLVLASTLGACGGGNSNSGAAVAPPVVKISEHPPGIYSGTRTTTFTHPRVDDTPQDSEYKITVTGSIEGQQQVEIRFRQWSGTSAIVIPGNTFSLPSGVYRVGAPASFGNCTAQKVIEGVFVGETASGTESGTITCDRLSGQIALNATFNVSLSGESKSSKLENSSPVLLEKF